VHRFHPSVLRLRPLILALAGLLALSGCSFKSKPPGEAPTGVTATPGDGLVTVAWNVLPNLTYWIFVQQGFSVDVGTPNAIAIRRAINPRVVTPLPNGTPFAFVMNATNNDSAAGPNSAPAFATPRLAGGLNTTTDNTTTWASATPLTSANLKDVAFNGTTFVTVGDAPINGGTPSPTIFAGSFDYPMGLIPPTVGGPQGVTEWFSPTQITPQGTPQGTLPLDWTQNPPNLSSVIWVPTGAFVTLALDGRVALSNDGLNWSAFGPVQDSTGTRASGMRDIAFAFGFNANTPPTYAAVGDGGQIWVNPGANLVTWEGPGQVQSNTPNDLNSVAAVNGSFFATGAGGTLVTSPDGTTPWTPQITNTTSTLRGVAFCSLCSLLTGVGYVAVGDAGTIITSNVGVGNPAPSSTDWSPVPASNITFIPPLTGPLPNLKGVTIGGSTGTRFLAVGDGGVVVFSDDGVNWTALLSGTTNLAKVSYSGGMYIGVGDAGANVVSR
jgi:hypothetical protein